MYYLTKCINNLIKYNIFFFNTKAVSHFDVPLEQVIPSHHLLRSICEDLLHIQVNIAKFSLSEFFDQSFKAKALFLEMLLLIYMYF